MQDFVAGIVGLGICCLFLTLGVVMSRMCIRQPLPAKPLHRKTMALIQSPSGDYSIGTMVTA
jgi:hypothetical protein